MPLSTRESQINPIDGATMIWIPGGEFRMGSTEEDVAAILQQNPAWEARWFAHEKPQRSVILPGYWMYETPVTVAQYRAFCDATEARMPAEPTWGWQDNHPMVNVSWDDALQYTDWANAALPTEEQWEKAARGEDLRWWPWGNEPDVTRSINATNASSTMPVGSIPAGDSPYGLKDMAGNIWEWCIASAQGDYLQQQPRMPQRRPSHPSTRVLRGGSWQCAYDTYLRCAYRCFDCEQQKGRGPYRRPTCGFRCVVAEEQG